MKAKLLLIIAAAFAVSFWSVNAQKLLISEEFSSAAWQAELLRLNPGGAPLNPLPYAARTPSVGATGNYAYTNMNTTELYFGKYKLAGDIEIINGEVHPKSDICTLDGGNHNVMITEGDSAGKYIPLGFRPFKTSGYIELPEITSAGLITVHVICGNLTDTSNLSIDKWENEQWKQISSEKIVKRSSMNGMVDRILTEDINSRIPIKLRLYKRNSANPYFAIFEFSVEEHFSAGLKHSIDSATVIKTENASNIGTANGQYPQSAYDDFSTSITNAKAIFDNTATTQTEVEDAELVLNTAITDFKASVNDIGTGINPIYKSTFKQYGRKLVINKPATISIYNTVGTLVYQQDQVQVMEIPATVGKGVFIVKSGPGVQKIYLGE